MRLTTADILKLVPEFMRKDEAVKGLATAVNKLIREPGEKVRTIRVWDQIDQLDDEQLDELAYELDIDWYSSSLPLEKKRAVVKISDLVHSRRGTKWAVEELISTYFSRGFVMEWYENGYVNPKPFHFSVYTSHRQVTDAILQEFRAIAKVAMSVRSRMDGVYFSDTYGSRVTVSSTDEAYFFTPKKCGTIPRPAVIGTIMTVDGAVAGLDTSAVSFESVETGVETTGVIPRTATVGAVLTAATAVVTNAAGNGRVVLAKCGTTKCGK
jgi:phage tail P2-like protein